jgi:predicted DNA-binding transcriptional regulator AlpA
MEKLLSAQQVASLLGMHPKTLYKRLRENRIALNFVRLSDRSIAFRPKDVETYLSTHEVVRVGGGKAKKKKEPAEASSRRKFRSRMLTAEEAHELFEEIHEDGEIKLRYKPKKEHTPPPG